MACGGRLAPSFRRSHLLNERQPEERENDDDDDDGKREEQDIKNDQD